MYANIRSINASDSAGMPCGIPALSLVLCVVVGKASLTATHHPLHGHSGNFTHNGLGHWILQQAPLAATLVLAAQGTTEHATKAAATAAEKAAKPSATEHARQSIRLLLLHARGVTSKFAGIIGLCDILPALFLQVLGKLATLIRREALLRFRCRVFEFLWRQSSRHRLIVIEHLIVVDVLVRGSCFIAIDEILGLVQLGIIIVLIAEESF